MEKLPEGCGEHRDAESEMGSRLPGESWRRDEGSRLDARTTEDSSNGFQSESIAICF